MLNQRDRWKVKDRVDSQVESVTSRLDKPSIDLRARMYLSKSTLTRCRQ